MNRSSNASRQHRVITQADRTTLLGQDPLVLWFTGLSGAGKTTLANGLARRLYDKGRHAYVLDGDSLRRGLNRDLDFSEPARRENVRRIAEVAGLVYDAGLIALVACISPFGPSGISRAGCSRQGNSSRYLRTPRSRCASDATQKGCTAGLGPARSRISPA